jgi:nucleoside phosphorylase
MKPVSDNPLHRLIDLLHCFIAAVWQCHHASTIEQKSQAMEHWTALRGPFWHTYRIPTEAFRGLADAALAWCSRGGFCASEHAATIEKAAQVVTELAKCTVPCSSPPLYANPDEAQQVWDREGEFLSAALAVQDDIRRLAAMSGHAWEWNGRFPWENCSNEHQEESEVGPPTARPTAAVDLPAYKIEEQPWCTPLPETRDLSSEELVSQASQIDVVVITATDTEIEAVLRRLQPLRRRRAILKGAFEQETYYLGRFGSCRAAVTKCRMGSLDSGGATLATEHAQRIWRPKAIVMVGIALGKDPSKQKIGDVLVASQVISYEPERVGETQVVSRGPISPANTTLLNRFENVPHWSFCRPDGSRCERHVGPLLSGEKLVDDPAFKAQLFERYPQAIGGDMEGVGLAAAAIRHGAPWILVKAICDWADGRKDKKHQPLAAAAAVSLVHHVLSQADVLHGLRKVNQSETHSPKQSREVAADPTTSLHDLHGRFVQAQDRFPREVSFALVMIPHDESQAWKTANKWFNDISHPPQNDGWKCLAYAGGGDTPETVRLPASEWDGAGGCPLLSSIESWRCWLLRQSPTAPYPVTALNMFYSLAVDGSRLLNLRDCGRILDGRHIPGGPGEYQHLLRWSIEQLDPEECQKLTWLDPPDEHVRTPLRPGRSPRRWMVEMPCVFAAVAHALERHLAGLGKPWPLP